MRSWVWVVVVLGSASCTANDGKQRSEFYTCLDDADCVERELRCDQAGTCGMVDVAVVCLAGQCAYAPPCANSLDCELPLGICDATAQHCVQCLLPSDCVSAGLGQSCDANRCH